MWQLKSIGVKQIEKITNLVVKNCGMIQSVIQSIDIHLSIKFMSLNGDRCMNSLKSTIYHSEVNYHSTLLQKNGVVQNT